MSEPASTQTSAGPPRIFLSYAHKDRREKDALLLQLVPLEHQSLISIWSDEKIGPGKEWLKEIDQALEAATIGVLLVSANYLASEFIRSREVPRLLKRHAEDTTIYPIIIKPCAWRAIDWLSSLQVRPLDGEPVWRDNGRFAEQELAEIAVELAGIAEKRTGQSTRPRNPQSVIYPSHPIEFDELKHKALAAIQAGAPEYNSGNVGACARRYARVVSLVQQNGIRGAAARQGHDDQPMADRPLSMPEEHDSMPGRHSSMPARSRKAGVDAETFLTPVVLSELTELYRAAGSINLESSTENLDHFAWQARYCFDRTLDVAEITDISVDAINNRRLQRRDIHRVLERIDRIALEIFMPDWPQKLTSVDSGINLVANLLSPVISAFLSAGILDDKAMMPAAAASELESVIREYDETGEDPYRLAWILHSFMMRVLQGT